MGFFLLRALGFTSPERQRRMIVSRRWRSGLVTIFFSS
jgi:hypothetical protein